VKCLGDFETMNNRRQKATAGVPSTLRIERNDRDAWLERNIVVRNALAEVIVRLRRGLR
jgi:hypothetical protein